MEQRPVHAAAIVGVGAILPDAPDAAAFWRNVEGGRYSISEVTADRWDAGLYYDADPKAPDKTYSKIGGWVRAFEWDPLGWKLPIPPKVAANQWHTLALKAEGDRFTVSFDGKALISTQDRTFPDAGKVALWTKADSVTYFDTISIMSVK